MNLVSDLIVFILCIRMSIKEKYKGIGCLLELFHNALHPLELATRNHAKLVCEVAKSPEHLGKTNRSTYIVLIHVRSSAGQVRAFEEGLTSFDPSVCMQCCAIIDNVCAVFYDIAHTGVGSPVGGGSDGKAGRFRMAI